MLLRSFEKLPTSENRFGYIESKWKSDYVIHQGIISSVWANAALNARLESGDTSRNGWGGTLSGGVSGQPNIRLSFNRTRPTLGFIGGYQRKNRKSTIVVPVESASQETADQYTRTLLAIYKREDVKETESQSFYNGACIAGIDFLHLYLDFRDDPINGDLKFRSVPVTYTFFDPYFKNNDLSDCSFITVRNYLDHATAASLLDKKYTDVIMNMPSAKSGIGNDGRFMYTAENIGQPNGRFVTYDEYYYRDYREQQMLVNKKTGSILDISYMPHIDVEALIEDFPELELIVQDVPTVRLAIMVNNQCFYDGPQPLMMDDYPFAATFGFFNKLSPNIYNRVQSVAYALRDTQTMYNQRLTLTSDISQSVANSGWIFKEDAIIDPNHLLTTGQGRLIPIKRTANIGDIAPIPGPQIPAGLFELGEIYGQQFTLATGVNEEMLGAATNDVAALLASYRQGAGLTTLQCLFDNFDFTVKRLGDLAIKAIKMNYTPTKIKKILGGEQPTDFFYDKDFSKFQCQVQLGFDTESQKQIAFAQIVQLKQLGYDIPASYAIEEAALQNKPKLMQFFQQQEEMQRQSNEMQMQLQQQQLQSQIRLSDATAMAQEGMYIERVSRVGENKALAEERKSKSINEDYEALLNYARALRELELIEKDIESRDIDHLRNLLLLQREEKEPRTNREFAY